MFRRLPWLACVLLAVALSLGMQIGLVATALADGSTSNGGTDPPMPPADDTATVPGGPGHALLDWMLRLAPRVVRVAMV